MTASLALFMIMVMGVPMMLVMMVVLAVSVVVLGMNPWGFLAVPLMGTIDQVCLLMNS